VPHQEKKLIGIARMAAEAPCLEPKKRVEYFELGARSYLARCDSTRVPFRWTINPYRGCEFGCKYCYARYTHEFMEMRDPEQFERKIYAKAFDAVRFRDELRALPLGEAIGLGTATDPYQPAERRYGVTRKMLEVFAGMGRLASGNHNQVRFGGTRRGPVEGNRPSALFESFDDRGPRWMRSLPGCWSRWRRAGSASGGCADAVRSRTPYRGRLRAGDAVDQRQRVEPGCTCPRCRSGWSGAIVGERFIPEALRLSGVPAVS